MPAKILRLLTLLALVLMPFGMGAASAAAGNAAPAAATAQHCDDHGGQPTKTSRDDAMSCAIACSMLVVAEAGVDAPAPDVREPAARPLAERGAGVHPDTATPPPKLS